VKFRPPKNSVQKVKSIQYPQNPEKRCSESESVEEKWYMQEEKRRRRRGAKPEGKK
jgi:hypothetical protein